MFPPHISWLLGFFWFFGELCSSIRSRDIHIFSWGRGYIWPPGIPVLIEIWVSNSYWHTWPQFPIILWKFCVAHSFSFWFIIKNVCTAFAREIRPHFKCLGNENNKMCHKSKSYDLRMVKRSRKLLLGHLSTLVRSKVKAPFWPGIAPTWQLASAEKGGPISPTFQNNQKRFHLCDCFVWLVVV